LDAREPSAVDADSGGLQSINYLTASLASQGLGCLPGEAAVGARPPAAPSDATLRARHCRWQPPVYGKHGASSVDNEPPGEPSR
jgi:hypothetical protein